MITTKDQEQLFQLIADYLDKNISCIAIGGTAMMFLGYKNATKDIDLVFQSSSDRNSFIKAIEQLGYKQQSLAGIYNEKKRLHKNVPLMYTRGDERFDLFVSSVFGLVLPFDVSILKMRVDFLEKSELIVHILPEEFLILCKVLTSRERDFDDIISIVRTKKDIDWIAVIDYAISQKAHKEWILIDLEEAMRKLQKVIFLKEELFKRIYSAQKI